MSNRWYINSEVRGNNVLLTYVHDGELKHAKVGGYEPVLFYGANGQQPTHKELVNGSPLVAKKFSNIRDANNAIREAHDIDGLTIYGNRNFNYTFLHENFTEMETSYDVNMIRGFFLDIECPSEVGFPDPGRADWPINLMGIYDTFSKKYHIWGMEQYLIDNYADKLLDEGVDPNDVNYYHISDETLLLENMVNWWQENYPAYITGWNTSSFDNPYLVNRLMKHGIDPGRLSPWGSTTIREREFQGKPVFNAHILGVADLDYLELYKKNRFKMQESYKLDHIAHVELGKNKVDYSEVAANLRTLHKKDWGLYATYNVMDVALVKQLDDKLGYLGITFAMAYSAGINYGDVSSPVGYWENVSYRDTIDQNIVLPPKKNHDKTSYEGGFVKTPQQGKHRWIVSFDLASLYPSLIRQYNISPETVTSHMVPTDVESMLSGISYGEHIDDLCVCPSGNTFRKDVKGLANSQMERLYFERKEFKKRMLKHQSNVQVIKSEIERRKKL